MNRTLHIDESMPVAEVKFRKTGGSYSMIIPVASAMALKVKDGSKATLSLSTTGDMVIRPNAKKKRYTLKELLKEAPEMDALDDLSTWESTPPMGDEI